MSTPLPPPSTSPSLPSSGTPTTTSSLEQTFFSSTVSPAKLEAIGFTLLERYIAERNGTGACASFDDRTSRVLLEMGKAFQRGTARCRGVEFQFRYSLYKARVVLLQEDNAGGKKVLKSLAQAKLELTGPDANQCPEQVSLLYAKAHYESLRSIAQPDLSEQRTARALKLAQDARAAGDPDSAVEEAVYQNNVGVIHQTVQKPDAALLYFSKSLSGLERREGGEAGKAQGYPAAEVLFNSGLAAFSAGKFLLAYQCLACASGYPEFSERPGLWVQIGHALLGVWEDLKARSLESGVVKGGSKEERRVPADLSGYQFGAWFKVSAAESHEDPGSLSDIEAVSLSPLPRAMNAFRTASGMSEDSCLTWLASEAGLAYCHLEVGDYAACFKTSKEALSAATSLPDSKELVLMRTNLWQYAMEAEATVVSLDAIEWKRKESQKGPDPEPPTPGFAYKSAIANLQGDYALAETLARKSIEENEHVAGDDVATRNLIYALQKKRAAGVGNPDEEITELKASLQRSVI